MSGERLGGGGGESPWVEATSSLERAGDNTDTATLQTDHSESFRGSELSWFYDEALSYSDYTDNEILNTDVFCAQEFLPYISLSSLSEREKADILRIADYAKFHTSKLAISKSPFYLYEHCSAALAEAVGQDAGYVTQKTMEAHKLFCADILNYSCDNTPATQQRIYRAFFSTSPSLNSYCGDLTDYLELLAISEKAGHNPCTRALFENIVYDCAASETNNEFIDSLVTAEPIRQLDMLATMQSFPDYVYGSDYEWLALNKISGAFSYLRKNPDATPLVRYTAEGIQQLWNGQYNDLVQDDQAKLAAEFPGLSDYYDMPGYRAPLYLTQIAPGIAATINENGRIDLIAKNKDALVSALKYDPDNTLGLKEKDTALLSIAHRPCIKRSIEDGVGVKLSDISLSGQIHLLNFMIGADDKRFNQLCSTLHGVDEKIRVKLAEGFLAADFGEDFGDALLEIADSPRINGEQLEKMLDEFNTCRASIRKITGLYNGYDDGEFAKQYARAANERLTDALMVFREIARRGESSAELGWFGEAGFDYVSALEALEYEAKSLEIISGTLGDVAAGVKGAFAEKFLHPDEQHGRSMYDFYSPEHGYVLLYTRPEGAGSFEPMLEYGKIRSKYDKNNNNSGVEASISLIVNPVDPYSLPNPFRPDHRKVKDMGYYDHATMDKVSAIRLDREGRAPDARPDDPNRDPINAVGAISVDLAAINDRVDTPSGKIARLFSVGNKLRSEDRTRNSVGVGAGGAGGEADTSLNHNTNWFNQSKYGVADGFSQLVGYVDRLATGWCASMPPQGNEGFTGMMRAVSRRRGAKVRRSA